MRRGLEADGRNLRNSISGDYRDCQCERYHPCAEERKRRADWGKHKEDDDLCYAEGTVFHRYPYRSSQPHKNVILDREDCRGRDRQHKGCRLNYAKAQWRCWGGEDLYAYQGYQRKQC